MKYKDIPWLTNSLSTIRYYTGFLSFSASSTARMNELFDHCSDCKHFVDDPTILAQYGWNKYIENMRCAAGEKIFFDLACSKFEERIP